MDFLLWAARTLHVFGVVVWFGGLTYQAVVTFPVLNIGNGSINDQQCRFIRRFQLFVWMCVWTVLVTGAGLMLFDSRFVFFRFDDRWSVLMGLKQVVFLMMMFFSFGYLRMFKRVEEAISSGQETTMAAPYFKQMMLFGKVNIALAIIALLLAAGLHS
jgi:uncharacterized membrane protein